MALTQEQIDRLYDEGKVSKETYDRMSNALSTKGAVDYTSTIAKATGINNPWSNAMQAGLSIGQQLAEQRAKKEIRDLAKQKEEGAVVEPTLSTESPWKEQPAKKAKDYVDIYDPKAPKMTTEQFIANGLKRPAETDEEKADRYAPTLNERTDKNGESYYKDDARGYWGDQKPDYNAWRIANEDAQIKAAREKEIAEKRAGLQGLRDAEREAERQKYIQQMDNGIDEFGNNAGLLASMMDNNTVKKKPLHEAIRERIAADAQPVNYQGKTVSLHADEDKVVKDLYDRLDGKNNDNLDTPVGSRYAGLTEVHEEELEHLHNMRKKHESDPVGEVQPKTSNITYGEMRPVPVSDQVEGSPSGYGKAIGRKVMDTWSDRWSKRLF